MKTSELRWRRDGADWVLMAGRRCMGRVVPDARYAGMYRSLLSRGRLSDMANLAWAKDAVLAAAERELEWGARHQPATDPRKCPESGGVFSAAAAPVAQTAAALPQPPSAA
jgi:hypothetical protein